MDTGKSNIDLSTVDVILHDAKELHATMQAFGLDRAAQCMNTVIEQLESDQRAAKAGAFFSGG